jgi:uncharacterized protein YndB with AHSA1/START domain
MPLRFKIQVGATPQKVFDIVSDIARHGDWANPSAGLEVKPVSGGPVQVGSTFKSSQKFAGKHTGADITVTKLAAPSALAFDAVQAGKKPVRFTNTFTLTPTADGTLVERSIDAKPANPLAIVFYPAIRADAMKSLRQLKAKAEGSR